MQEKYEYFINRRMCPKCKIENPESARFCCMCGKSLTDLHSGDIIAINRGTRPVVEKTIRTPYGDKSVKVLCRDITTLTEEVDLLVVSAYQYAYRPTRGTVIGALHENLGISVDELSEDPIADLRASAGCWLSEEVNAGNIGRIGCVELIDLDDMQAGANLESIILGRVKAFFSMLDAVTANGISIKSIAMPILGAGHQRIDAQMMMYPLLNEVTEFLRRNEDVKEVTFVERSLEKAMSLAAVIAKSYQLSVGEKVKRIGKARPFVFISYTNDGDSESAEILTRLFEEKNIDYWYAPRSIKEGAYAEAIVEGIRSCTHFVCLVSERSMRSNHVLNEIDLAFKQIGEGVEILPVFLDVNFDELSPSFEYYLSRMQFHNGRPAPNEKLLRKFVEEIFEKN